MRLTYHKYRLSGLRKKLREKFRRQESLPNSRAAPKDAETDPQQTAGSPTVETIYPDINTVPKTARSQGNRTQQAESKEKPRDLGKRLTPWKFAMAVIGMLIVGLQTWILYNQQVTMQDQSVILNNSIQEAIRTREIENRAYVNAIGGKITKPVGVGIQGVVEIDLKNAGRVPAYYVEENVDCRFHASIPVRLPPNCTPLRSSVSSVIAPGTTEFMGVVLPPLESWQKALWDNGILHVAISGYIFYWDEFIIKDGKRGAPRRDPFCVAASGPSGDSLQPCTKSDWKYADRLFEYRR